MCIFGDIAVVTMSVEEAGYVDIHKEFRGKKPHTVIQLTEDGRMAFRAYKRQMQDVLSDLPD